MNDDMLLKLIEEREQQLEAEAAAGAPEIDDDMRARAISSLIMRARHDSAARDRLEAICGIIPQTRAGPG